MHIARPYHSLQKAVNLHRFLPAVSGGMYNVGLHAMTAFMRCHGLKLPLNAVGSD